MGKVVPLRGGAGLFGVFRDAVGDPTLCSEDKTWLLFPCHMSFLLYKPSQTEHWRVRKPQMQRLF